MRSNNYKSVLKHAGLAATVLLLASGAAFGQVSLTAGPTTATLPDGAAVPMWGYTCGAAVVSLTWTAPRPGTYLIESGTHPSIQGPMGLYGILVVTDTTTTPATAYPAVGTTAAVTYNADIPLLLSEIDPVQNAAVQAAVGKTGFSETKVWSGLYGGCGNPLNADGT